MLKIANIDLIQPTILYCNTGFTASSVAFAFFILGFDNIPIYKGSWNEYSLIKIDEIERQNEKKEIP